MPVKRLVGEPVCSAETGAASISQPRFTKASIRRRAGRTRRIVRRTVRAIPGLIIRILLYLDDDGRALRADGVSLRRVGYTSAGIHAIVKELAPRGLPLPLASLLLLPRRLILGNWASERKDSRN